MEVLTSHFKYCENSLSALSYSDQCCDDGCQVLVGGHPRLLEDLHGVEDDGEGSGEEGEVEAGEDDEEGGPDLPPGEVPQRLGQRDPVALLVSRLLQSLQLSADVLLAPSHRKY